MQYRQIQFDNELKAMQSAAKAAGQSRVRVVSQDLHNRVVTTKDNRMPTACDAMWKLWREQGSGKNRIINTTASDKSSTIEIEFDTL